ncbi:MAG TPA: NAD(P)/FAD-dependent oxidoreductase [Thermoanaerobaculia bacterium]|nr:NAD(P)/FAD-dependent oxidoreductase [Thermoanaerobaculia bacterium]
MAVSDPAAPPEALPVVVVGAGPAGLAVAGALARRGVRATLLEAGEAPGASWRRHYPFLRLHTTRRDSSLPGRPMPGGGDRYPGRDEYARYLEDYARWLGADVRTGREVVGVRRRDGAWEVEARGGEEPWPLRARHAVIAAGFNRRPVRPELPGEEAFGGPVLHSSRWHELGEVAGRRVLVVGLGNTGADLVEELHRAGARVAVAVRGPVHLVPLEVAGINWRTWYRLVPGLAFAAGRLGGPPLRRLAPRAAAAFWCAIARARFGDLEGRGLRLQRAGELVAHWGARRPPLTSGPFVEAIRRGGVEVLPALAGLEPGAALLADGGRHPCDAVVLATGFRPALEELLPPEALPEPGGWPPDGRPGPLPGLWFCGYLPEVLRIRRSARRLARRVAADLAGR